MHLPQSPRALNMPVDFAKNPEFVFVKNTIIKSPMSMPKITTIVVEFTSAFKYFNFIKSTQTAIYIIGLHFTSTVLQ